MKFFNILAVSATATAATAIPTNFAATEMGNITSPIIQTWEKPVRPLRTYKDLFPEPDEYFRWSHPPAPLPKGYRLPDRPMITTLDEEPYALSSCYQDCFWRANKIDRVDLQHLSVDEWCNKQWANEVENWLFNHIAPCVAETCTRVGQKMLASYWLNQTCGWKSW